MKITEINAYNLIRRNQIPEEDQDLNLIKSDPDYYDGYRYGKFLNLKLYDSNNILLKEFISPDINNIDMHISGQQGQDFDGLCIWMLNKYITQEGINYLEELYDEIYKIYPKTKKVIGEFLRWNYLRQEFLDEKVIATLEPFAMKFPEFSINDNYHGIDGNDNFYVIIEILGLNPFTKYERYVYNNGIK